MANNTFQIRRTVTSGRTPNTTSSGNSQFINVGELALNLTDGILYSSNSTLGLITVGSNLTSLNVTGGTASLGLTVANSTSINATFIGIGNTVANSILSSGSIVFANSTSNASLTIPTPAQWTGNYFLHANGSWQTPTGGSAAPAGGNTSVQYNNSGTTAGSLSFTFNSTNLTVSFGNTVNVSANGILFNDYGTGTLQTVAMTNGKALALASGMAMP